ncbi:MAG: HEAT repeat domain-containing protein [Betaproteobacteria bacterium]|nr:HEAT repeat domain-containing protein [Betaproteobacteria bacterium]
MVSAAFSDSVVRYVAWTGLVMLVLILLMLFQIARLRYALHDRVAQEQRFLDLWRPLLMQELSGIRTELPPLNPGEEEPFLKLWNHLQETLRGPAHQHLNEVAVRCGMADYAKRLLEQGALRSRLLALATLGQLGERSVWNGILEMTRDPDSLLSMAALGALLKIDAAEALRELLPRMIEREDWPVPQLAILIEEAGEHSSFALLMDAAEQMAGARDPEALDRLRRVLQLLEVAPPQQALPVARRILELATDEEVLAQCLRFLLEPSDLPAVRRLAGHEAWAVRLQAAHALSRIGSLQDVPVLSKLLSDPVWWVRYRSAQALVSLARGDDAVLARIREQVDDRLGRDMLAMAMVEGGKS